MNSKITPFQAVIFGILVLVIIVGVLLFALQKSSSEQKSTPVTMWGTVSASIVNDLQNQINSADKDSLQITYTEFSEQEFNGVLLEALASGTGPDIMLLDDDSIINQENKLFLIGYDFYPQSDFQTNFVEAGEILLRPEGSIGIPFMIDPLVLYWNRTILNNNGVAQPPQYWDEFLTLIPDFVEANSAGNINKAGVALGEFRNINQAKEILATLVRQAGNPIITRDIELGGYQAIFDQRLGYKTRPADAAISFFTQFSNPSREVYSWNRSLPNADETFLAGDLAFYLGFASERQSLINKNPNLNFAVSLLPQSRSSSEKSVNAKMHFLAISNRSANIAGAYNTIAKLTGPESLAILSDITDLPPVRRDLLNAESGSAYKSVFNSSSLISKIFIDPDKNVTQEIFQSMIESVTSGRTTISESVTRAQLELNDLLE